MPRRFNDLQLNSAQIDHIAVAPDARRQGQGRALLDAARALARDLEADEILLDTWEANHDAHAFFRDKFAADLVLLADNDFTWFTKNATVVEPHVRIDNKTGTASDGGLFYTENLPPEALMLGSLMASRERSGKAEMAAEAVLSQVSGAIDGQLLQVGGDATTGRGLVAARVITGTAN